MTPTVADARFAKPLDAELINRLAADHELIVTIEENVLPGGFGSAVLEHLEDADISGRARVLRIGLPDRYVTHGKPALIREEVGFTGEAVAERVHGGAGRQGQVSRSSSIRRLQGLVAGLGMLGRGWLVLGETSAPSLLGTQSRLHCSASVVDVPRPAQRYRQPPAHHQLRPARCPRRR